MPRHFETVVDIGQAKLSLLDTLLDTLPIVQKVAKLTEPSNPISRQSTEFRRAFRNTLFSFSHIFKNLKSAGYEVELVSHTEHILRCFENLFSDNVLRKLNPQKIKAYPYPRLQAVRNWILDVRSSNLSEDQTFRILQSSIDFGTEEEQRLLNTTLAGVLEELEVGFSQTLENGEEPQPRKRRKQPLSAVWESTSRAYTALSRCRDCTRHRDLDACLHLATYSDRADLGELCSLDLLFAFDDDRNAWGEVTIRTRIVDEGDATARVPKVRFAPHLDDSSRWQNSKPKCIGRICDVFVRKPLAKSFRMNLVLESDDQLWAHKPTERVFALDKLGQSISLEQLITLPFKNWNEMEKLVLALILGYSLFYLYDGPWIARAWPSESITFFRSGNSIPLRPFLRTPCSNSDSDQDGPESLFHQYPVLVGFAVTLLEIHLGQTLEAYLDLDETLMDIDDLWARATEAYTKRERHISWPSYRNTIKACLDPTFEVPEVFKGNELRDLIYNKVVEPLEADLDHAFSAFISVDNLDQEAPKLNLGLGPGHTQSRPLTDKPKESSFFTKADDSIRTKTVPSSRQENPTRAPSLPDDIPSERQPEIFPRGCVGRQGLAKKDGVVKDATGTVHQLRMALSLPATISELESSPSYGNITDSNPWLDRFDAENQHVKALTGASSRSRYTVGILCALPKELMAVRALFDSRHGSLEMVQGDSNQYALGEMAQHMVVAACLPAGEYGTNSAAAAASNMTRSFTSIRFCLLVGIAGGVPSEKSDVRLGDVVVSHPTGTCSGVLQYDLGKEKEGEPFEPMGTLQRPPRVLATAISVLRSDPDLGPDPLGPHLRKIAGRFPAYGHPGPELDVLFQTACATCGSRKMCSGGCSHVLQRVPRLTAAPAIHYGPVASGNRVIKDVTFRDRLARESGVLCFEMEAAGIINAVDCLVIRGICDYCDAHKNDAWQEYAAATAAAYAKLLLSNVAGRGCR